jgi:hypothetical protein
MGPKAAILGKKVPDPFIFPLVIQPLVVKHNLRKLLGLACFRLELRASSPRYILFLQA